MNRHDLERLQMDKIPSSSGVLRLEGLATLDDNFGKGAVEDSSWVSIGPGEPFKPNFLFILFCKSGKLRFQINLKEFTLSANDILLCYPGMIIDGLQVTRDMRVGLIAFDHDEFFRDSFCQSMTVIRRNMVVPQLLHVSEKQMSMVTTAYGMMRSILQQDGFGFKRDAIAGSLVIIGSMLAQWITQARPENRNPAKSRDESLFISFLSEVQAHCSEERKISYYADKFCISPKYFAKLIYNVSGRHATEWIRDYVIQEAKSMLRAGSYTVQQVSDAMNFPNSSFFGKYFKAAVGVSPRRYMIESS